jgi:DUF1365 family protein
MKNAIYEGIVFHKRLRPKEHQFKYGVNYFFFDLGKPDNLITIPFLLGFDSKNYLKKDQVEAEVQARFGDSYESIRSVFILTQLSYFGFCFNPVSFYYCFGDEDKLLYVVSQITNTPWGEKHIDCFDFGKSKGSFNFSKNFHVSPFMPMEIDYHWQFNSPADKVQILMKNQNHGEADSFFTVSMDLSYKVLNIKNVFTGLLFYPLMSLKTVYGIYWQALILYLKRVPFYTHPKKREAL